MSTTEAATTTTTGVQQDRLYTKLYQTVKSDKVDDGPFLVDVVFSFDTTGSMASVISSVRSNLTSTVDRLFATVEGIRIGIIVHGDYCDFPNMMWLLEPTKDQEMIKNFIKESPDTSGGDAPECYEMALYAANRIEWKADVKVLVVIGDAEPHSKGYPLPPRVRNHIDKHTLDIDWKAEVEVCKENKITVFSCHAQPRPHTLSFYDHISRVTGGYYFPLTQLQAFKDYMVAICLRAADSADTLADIEQSRRELDEQLQNLRIRTETAQTVEEREYLTREAAVLSRDYEECDTVLSAARTEGVFSPAIVNSSKKYKKALATRLATFETEIRSARVMDEGTSATLDILSDRTERSVPAAVATSFAISSGSYTPSLDDDVPSAFGTAATPMSDDEDTEPAEFTPVPPPRRPSSEKGWIRSLFSRFKKDDDEEEEKKVLGRTGASASEDAARAARESRRRVLLTPAKPKTPVVRSTLFDSSSSSDEDTESRSTMFKSVLEREGVDEHEKKD